MNMTSDWVESFVRLGRVARLATANKAGHPHIIPIVYAYDGRLITPLDEKPKRVPARRLRRVQDIAENPSVAVIIDEYSEDWETLAWVQLRGQAKIVERGQVHREGTALLHAKYPQYADMPLDERPLIVIEVERIIGWKADQG